jgi:hypothetical protein
MGMLIRRHRDRHEADAAKAEKPKRQRNRRKPEQPADQPPAPEDNPYDGLTDEQVAEAYATNVGGEDTERDAQVAALQALEADTPEDNSGE